MKGTWFPFLLISILLGLLVLLAALQYQWLGQISDADRIRLEKRLQDDTKRFADEFNRKIRDSYVLFQLTSKSLDKFPARYRFWQGETEYPGIIKEFYFVKNDVDALPSRFEEEKKKFVEIPWSRELIRIKRFYSKRGGIDLMLDDHEIVVLIPIYESREDFKKILIRAKKFRSGKIQRTVKFPKRFGFLAIKLSENVIKKKILLDLADKYFSGSDGENYNLSVIDENRNTIFQTNDSELSDSDAETKLFTLFQDNVWVDKSQEPVELNRNKPRDTTKMGGKQKSPVTNELKISVEYTDKMIGEIGRDINVYNYPLHNTQRKNGKVTRGLWTLRVQHTAGSLDQFIRNTRRRNLGISFGILLVLATSVILIFLSSQRARALAQRQLDFVSSVSHEFRTPLSVIYSAGENLSDGVIGEPERISNYGTLIKREGKKLSGMVEQILEFAGAQSGNRKYDFRATDVRSVIEEALNEFGPLIKEHDFSVETDIPEKLPEIMADKNALKQAIQNLISNSLKYSNGSKWLRVSAQMIKGEVRIEVQDNGIGISTKDKKHIFEPFYRADNVTDEQISGNGLGLSLVKQIVEAHGGEIEVESEVDKGSKFTLRIPYEV